MHVVCDWRDIGLCVHVQATELMQDTMDRAAKAQDKQDKRLAKALAKEEQQQQQHG